MSAELTRIGRFETGEGARRRFARYALQHDARSAGDVTLRLEDGTRERDQEGQECVTDHRKRWESW
jgi:hypothetical protein